MIARPPVAWRSTAVRLALAALPTWFTVAVLVFHTPWRIKLIVGSIFAAALISPAHALLALAVLAPFGRVIGLAFDMGTFRVSEALVLAFFAGWLLPPREDKPGPRVPATVAWLAALMVGASIVAQWWRLAQYSGVLGEFTQILYQAYYIIPDRAGFGAGARLFEGLGLMAAVVTLFRSRPRLAMGLPLAMSIAAFAAACSSLLLMKGIGLGPILAESVRTSPRVSAHVGDVNAAASYFGMMLILVLGTAARDWSKWRLLRVVFALPLFAALWVTGSRTGVAATLIVGVAAVLCGIALRWPRVLRNATLIAIIAAAIGAGAFRAWTLRHDAGTDFRRDFNATSGRMIAARPLTGVGIGQYYDASPLFLSRFLGWFYGRENAHNFFLQLTAELGVLGAAPFLTLLALVLRKGLHAILRRPDDVRLIGCEAAAAAFLITCLTGHPLLVDEVAFPFWMLFGLLVGLSGFVPARVEGSTNVEATSPALSPSLIVAISAAALLVFAIGTRRQLTPSDSPGVTGLERWETAPDGTRYRWTLDYASLFVPQKATRVYVPVRLPVDLPSLGPMGVVVKTAGLYCGRWVVGTSWATLNIELPPLDTLQAYRRVDIKVDRTWQPAIYIPGSHDLRRVGVQVGEI